jgi:malate dehydrogenase (oxaloacetate-decarboxylating)(NADP+)
VTSNHNIFQSVLTSQQHVCFPRNWPRRNSLQSLAHQPRDGKYLCQLRSTVLLTSLEIYASAVALSTAINTNEINAGRLYPELDRIREVSVIVAREVIREAQRQRLDGERSIRDLSDAELDAWIRVRMYDPTKENGKDDQSEAWKVRGSPQKSLL